MRKVDMQRGDRYLSIIKRTKIGSGRRLGALLAEPDPVIFAPTQVRTLLRGPDVDIPEPLARDFDFSDLCGCKTWEIDVHDHVVGPAGFKEAANDAGRKGFSGIVAPISFVETHL